ncbi:hypothetical protein FA13DRAFT_1711589 [Coprinellus micaceus]|uniref:Uncharacterized protein n=1 Tax=Coprinellus micaceus TaxID=71717 RepID=A0A4Y7T4N9_COPMI|nr:hypothetical protein FA13DRAFT_1711589 [Coprinellus micaceus]
MAARRPAILTILTAPPQTERERTGKLRQAPFYGPGATNPPTSLGLRVLNQGLIERTCQACRSGHIDKGSGVLLRTPDQGHVGCDVDVHLRLHAPAGTAGLGGGVSGLMTKVVAIPHAPSSPSNSSAREAARTMSDICSYQSDQMRRSDPAMPEFSTASHILDESKNQLSDSPGKDVTKLAGPEKLPMGRIS